jgi:hypothetical protein
MLNWEARITLPYGSTEAILKLGIRPWVHAHWPDPVCFWLLESWRNSPVLWRTEPFESNNYISDSNGYADMTEVWWQRTSLVPLIRPAPVKTAPYYNNSPQVWCTIIVQGPVRPRNVQFSPLHSNGYMGWLVYKYTPTNTLKTQELHQTSPHLVQLLPSIQ